MEATDGKRDEEFHARLDSLARSIEVAIRDGRQTLEALPEFEEGRSERAKNLDGFMRRFGGS